MKQSTHTIVMVLLLTVGTTWEKNTPITFIRLLKVSAVFRVKRFSHRRNSGFIFIVHFWHNDGPNKCIVCDWQLITL